jgi:O-antigen/teichoic acid export membrane protein
MAPTTLVARNSVYSVLRTTSGAFLALLLPAVLVREVGPEAFAVWAIGVEIATYLALLELGSFSAVGHFIAAAGPRAGADDHGRVMSTVLALQLAVVLTGSVLLGLLVLALPAVYSQMPEHLVSSGRWTLALVGGASLLGLLPTILSAYFLTLHRVLRPALITFLSRLAGAVLVTVLAVRGTGISGLALAWAGATVAGHVAIAVAFSRLQVPVRVSLASKALARRMVGFCGAYAAWVLAGLLVVGLDTAIVARIDFRYVAAYAAAIGAVSMIGAVYGSALTAILPVTARLAVAGDREGLSALLLRLIRWGGTGALAASALLALYAGPVLEMWVGAETATRGEQLLQVLVAANAVRLLMMPYPMLLFASGEHRHIRTTPFVEGFVNIAASVALGIAVGPVGVALGTLIGAAVGVALHLFVNIPRTRSLAVLPRDVLRSALGPPLVVAVPAVVALVADPLLGPDWRGAVRALAALATVGLAWAAGLHDSERREVRRQVRQRVLRRAAPNLQP